MTLFMGNEAENNYFYLDSIKIRLATGYRQGIPSKKEDLLSRTRDDRFLIQQQHSERVQAAYFLLLWDRSLCRTRLASRVFIMPLNKYPFAKCDKFMTERRLCTFKYDRVEYASASMLSRMHTEYTHRQKCNFGKFLWHRNVFFSTCCQRFWFFRNFLLFEHEQHWMCARHGEMLRAFDVMISQKIP